MVGRLSNGEMLGDLVTLSQVGVVGNLSDAELLDRFLGRRSAAAEAAFEAIVTRHGPMVLAVCGNVLRNPHDAQDAFQATFLVLASRAGSIRRRDSLASWLLGVARRVALRSRAAVARRRMVERQAAETKADRAESLPEFWPELHEEIGRLPERYRAPVVLCYLEGLSTEAAALRLSCPHGTVLSRLSRGRDRLRSGLTRRGLALPAGLLVTGLSPESTRAAIPADLLDATVRAALKFADHSAAETALSSTTAVSLAKGVICAMMITKLKILSVAALACVLAAGGLHTFARQVVGAGKTSSNMGAEPQADDRQAALIHTVDKLQADLDKSVWLNAKLQTELQDLRANLELLRASQPVAGKAKFTSEKAKAEGPTTSNVDHEKLFTQAGDLIFAASSGGDKVVAHRIGTGESMSLRLHAPGDAPLVVTPLVGPISVSLLMEGPKIVRIAVFNLRDSKWYPQDLREPFAGKVYPIVGSDIVVYSLGRRAYAFSLRAQRWDVAELPDGASVQPIVSPGSATLRWKNHIYIFSSESGKWKYIDIDAIVAGADDEEKETTKPRK